MGWLAGNQMVEGLDHCDDAGQEGDAFALQPMWVAGAIVRLVVVQNDLDHLGGRLEGQQQPCADFRMTLERLPLPVIQPAG